MTVVTKVFLRLLRLYVNQALVKNTKFFESPFAKMSTGIFLAALPIRAHMLSLSLILCTVVSFRIVHFLCYGEIGSWLWKSFGKVLEILSLKSVRTME